MSIAKKKYDVMNNRNLTNEQKQNAVIKLEQELAQSIDVKDFIKICRKKGGILDYMRNEIKKCNSCYVY